MEMITIKRLFIVASILAILLVSGCEGAIELKYANESLPQDSISKKGINKYYDYDNNVTCYYAKSVGSISCLEGIKK